MGGGSQPVDVGQLQAKFKVITYFLFESFVLLINGLCSAKLTIVCDCSLV